MSAIKTTLTTNARELTGKKVKQLRREGLLPAVVFGPKHEPNNVTVDQKVFHKIYKEAGHSKLVPTELDGKKVQVIIKEVQEHPVTHSYIHASLYAVDMNSEMETLIPVRIEGIAPAVKNNIGILSVSKDEIMVRCLPGDIPAEIVVSIDNLAEIGDGVSAKDLNLGENVELSSSQNPDEVFISIVPPQKEIEEETPAEGEAVEGAEGAAAEGDAAASESAAE